MPTHPETHLVTAGHAEEPCFRPVNTPVHRASTVLFPDYATFEASEAGKNDHPTYGLYGSPTTWNLERALAELEGADGAYLVSSGMAAIAGTLLTLLSQGDHLLMTDAVYGPTRRLCDHELKRYGIETTYYDPLIGGDIAALVQENTRMIYLEPPGSLTFEMQDIEAIAGVAKERNILVVSDNTWATPLWFKPFAWGVDVSIHAATKYIGGHSDLMMGVVAFREKHRTRLNRMRRNMGLCTNGDEAFLAARGLRTLAVRLKQHQASALEVARWLAGRPEVARVLHPALEEDPGHALWKKYMAGSCGLFAFQFAAADREKLAAFIDRLELFGLGYSWGGYESLVMPFRPAQIRTATRDHWGKEDICVRLHIGLEHPADLIADLEAAFAAMG